MATVTFGQELQQISEVARPYPAHLLPEGGTALCLFSAAFLGHNDVIHMARKGMVAVCVDVDGTRLEQMSRIYPADWEFVTCDAWGYALQARRQGRRFDAVTVDTFTGTAELDALGSLELWCSLAERVVTATCSKGRLLPPAPDGWARGLYERSSDVNWLVLTKREA